MSKAQMVEKAKENCFIELPFYLNHIQFNLFAISAVGTVVITVINMVWALIYYLELPLT